MRQIDSCIVVPANSSFEESNPSTTSNGTYKVGSTLDEKASGQERTVSTYESWPCSSADLLTLEKGFALDTCWYVVVIRFVARN
jgi:hypothetical protein